MRFFFAKNGVSECYRDFSSVVAHRMYDTARAELTGRSVSKGVVAQKQVINDSSIRLCFRMERHG